jgi:Domain of unknown function (DUF4917)
MVDLLQWRDIADDFGDVLGNGASVAVHSEFRYASLKQEAKDRGFLTDETSPFDVEEVFGLLGTDDFELVLNLLWHARRVNEAFSIEDPKTGPAYRIVRDALIKTVREVHCSRGAIQHHLKSIYEFMDGFETVLSLNYDLIVYWALLEGIDNLGYGRFRDCFTGDRMFDLDRAQEETSYTRGKPDSTLVCYPHGNLVLAEKPQEGEWKIVALRANFLLDQILGIWQRDLGIPLFVSEGLSEQKRGRIEGSPYLRMVYREILPGAGDNVTIYGWDLQENDQHLINQLFGRQKTKVAVSVYPPAVEDVEGHCHRIRSAILGASPSRHRTEINFFDAESDGCWIHP